MSRTGTSILPLHYGHPPEYLYRRMVKLSGLISDLIIEKFGSEHLLQNIADPFWFHSLSLATGFDWNSSGTTTATLSALKEYYSKKGDNIVIIGGKGKQMGKLAEDLNSAVDMGFISDQKAQSLRRNAKDLAKADNNLLQDTYDLYLQFVVLDGKGRWSLVQQGMNSSLRMARRYHWIYNTASERLNDGRSGISTKKIVEEALDLTTKFSERNRRDMVELAREGAHKYYYSVATDKQKTLDSFSRDEPILRLDYKINWKKMRELYEYQPKDFDELSNFTGVGKSTIRALSYIAEVIYGDRPSFVDPVKFSFGLGGKDGVPKPVNVSDYDKAIEFYDELLHGSDHRKIILDNIAKGMAHYSYLATSGVHRVNNGNAGSYGEQ